MRKHRSDRIIGVLVILLLLVSLVVIYAVGPMRANYINAAYGEEVYGTNDFFFHQLVSVVMSVVAFFVAFKVPYEKVRKYSKYVIVAGLGACALLALLAAVGSSLARCQLGACRWFNLGGLGSFQPAELLKLGLVLYLAQLVAERKKEGKIGKSDFWVPIVVVGGLSFILVVLAQKDFGTGAVLLAIILSIILVSGVDLKVFGLIIAGTAVACVLAVVTSPHRMERMMTYLGGDGADTYHIENALIAIGTGGLGGVGVGNSVQATGYLPESINDSVFAIMGETFGFIGLMGVVLCFAGILTRILKIAGTAENDEQSFIAVGMFAWVMAHLALNIMAMTGILPLTGITLPLLSYGGTSMIFIAVGLGLCLQISCYTGREEATRKGIVKGARR